MPQTLTDPTALARRLGRWRLMNYRASGGEQHGSLARLLALPATLLLWALFFFLW